MDTGSAAITRIVHVVSYCSRCAITRIVLVLIESLPLEQVLSLPLEQVHSLSTVAYVDQQLLQKGAVRYECEQRPCLTPIGP